MLKRKTKERKENKCERLKMEHAWENITPNIVYPTMPPQYPDHTEKCINCGLQRWFREKRETWVEYSDGKDRTTELPDGNINLVGDGTGAVSIKNAIRLNLATTKESYGIKNK